MITRAAYLAIGLALAGCSQGAPPATEAETAAPTDTMADDPVTADAELLAGTVLQGRWEEVGDDADVGVRFTSPDYPDTLTIGCNQGSGDVYINWSVRDPLSDGEVRVITTGGAVTFAATAANYEENYLNIAVEGNDPRLASLKTVQERFAVQAFGQAILVPWVPSIAATLNDCPG